LQRIAKPTSRIVDAKGNHTMKSWQLVRLIAGLFILASLAMGIEESPLYVSSWWLAFTAFVGANLLQSALTRWCLMETLLRKLGLEPGC